MKHDPLFWLLLLLLCCSCMKSDNSNCVPSALSFSYTAGGESNVLSDYITDITICVFDESTGRYINRFSVSREQLLSPGGVPLDLPDGTYRIVCWGNSGANSHLFIGDTWQESRIGHPSVFDSSSVPDTNDPLYYAVTILTVKRGVSTVASLDFECAHISLVLYIKGLDASMLPIVRFDHLTPQMDFGMQAVDAHSVSYCPQVGYDPSQSCHVARLSVLRFATDNPITLEILEPSGSSLYTLSLAEFMATNDLPSTRAIVTEGVQELTIPIEVYFKGTSVTVSLPSWGSDSVKPGIEED